MPSSIASDGSLAASIKVITGASAGREIPLTKVVTTFGKPGIVVAAITKRPHGFELAHVEGNQPILLNGQPISFDRTSLKHSDEIDLAGTRLQFVII